LQFFFTARPQKRLRPICPKLRISGFASESVCDESDCLFHEKGFGVSFGQTFAVVVFSQNENQRTPVLLSIRCRAIPGSALAAASTGQVRFA